MVRTDFVDFCSEIVIMDKKRREKIPFILNNIQLQFVQDMHTRNVVVKPRQVGFTTLCRTLILYFAKETHDLNIGILFQDEKAARKQTRDLQKFIEEHGESVGLKISPRASALDGFEITPNNIFVAVDTAGAANPFRSQTMDFILASEVGFWKNVDNVIDAVLPAVGEDGIIIYESSPSLEGKAFANLYYEGKTNTEQAKERNLPIDKEKVKSFFFSFLDFHDYGKTPPDDWIPSPEDMSFFRENEKTTMDHVFFRRSVLGENPTPAKYNYFRTNFPIDDLTCFQSADSSTAFNYEELSKFVFSNPADLQNPRFSKHKFLHQYIGGNSLRIFEEANAHMDYFFGIDTAKGNGGDANAIVVVGVNQNDKGSGRVVCAYSDNMIAFTDFHRVVADLYRYFMFPNRNSVYILIESNMHGDSVMHMLKETIVGNGFTGIRTTKDIKSKIIANIENYILSGEEEEHNRGIRDEILLAQLKKYSTDPKIAKHQSDDLVVAFGLALQAKKVNFGTSRPGFALTYDPSSGKVVPIGMNDRTQGVARW